MFGLFEVRLKILSDGKKLTTAVMCLSILTFQDFQHSVIDKFCFKQMHRQDCIKPKLQQKKLESMLAAKYSYFRRVSNETIRENGNVLYGVVPSAWLTCGH